MKKFTLLSIILFMAVTMGNSLFAQQAKENDEPVEVATIHELRQGAGDGLEYLLTGEAFLTYQESFRNSKYVQDATGGILIDDNGGIITTSYNIYDGITGLKGTVSVFNDMVQFVPTEDPGTATSENNIIEPLVITMDDFMNDFMTYQARLVTIEDITFVDPEGNFANGQVYPITDGTDEINFRSTFFNVDYIGSPVPSYPFNLTGLPHSRGTGNYIVARNWADIESLVVYDVTFDVVDENDDPITDAEITFMGESYPEGEYFFEGIPAGAHPYSIEKDGFFTRQGLVNVADDITYKVVLVEVSEDLVDVFPWMEGFEDEVIPPANWNHLAYGGGGWAITSTANSGTSAANHTFTTQEADSWLVSPQIKLPLETGMLLTIFHRNAFMGDYDYSGVKISTGSGNPEQGEFIELFEASTPVGSYTERIINLADYAGEVVYIAFVYKGEDAHQWFIDDIKIEAAPEAIQVPNLASLRDQELGDLIYEITGEVFITHQQLAYRNQIFIQDETGAILIDDGAGIIETEFENYDGIIGLKGRLGEFQNMLQFVPTEDPGAANSSDNLVEPIEVTLDQLSKDHESWLVIVRNVSFVDPEGVNFTHNVSFPITDPTGEGVIRTPNSADLLDYFGTPLPTTAKDLVGVVTQRFEETRLLPRSLADFLTPTSIEEIEAAGFSMYPNPAVSHFNVVGESIIDYLRVYNLTGQVVIHQAVDNNSVQVDLSSLKSGIYIVQVIAGQKRMNYKLQVTR